MKTARRVLLDEIIASVISGSVNAKKHPLLKSEPFSAAACAEGTLSSQVSNEKEKTLLKTEAAVSEKIINKWGPIATLPLKTTKSIGNIENFQASFSAVCRVIYDHCIQVMWNAVFYDTVAAYSSAWRKEKLWFSSPEIPVRASNCRGSRGNVSSKPSKPDKLLTCRTDSSSCNVYCSDEVEIATETASNSTESSRLVILPCSDVRQGVIGSISESVENELFLSLTTYLTDFIRVLVEDEAKTTALTVRDNKIQELLKKSLFENLSPSNDCLGKQAALEVSGGTKNSLSGSSRFVVSNDSQNLLQEGDSSQKYTYRNTMASIFGTALKKSRNSVTDVNDEPDIYELHPPGSEDNVEMPSLPSKFQPLKSKECSPKIKEYVAMALCRQKLHEDVVRDWKTLFMECSLCAFLASWNRMHFDSDKIEVQKGNHELSRKKTLGCSKLRTSTRNVKSAKSCLQDQTAEKPRPKTLGDVPNGNKATQTTKTSEKTLIKKGSKKSSTDLLPLKRRQRNMTKVDRQVEKKIIMKDGTKVWKKKVPHGDLNKVISKKGQDIGLKEDFDDDDVPITRLKTGASRNKTKALTEETNAATSCEVEATSTEDSGKTIDCKGCKERLYDSLRKVRKPNTSELKRMHLSNIEVRDLGTKSSNKTVGRVAEVSGKKLDGGLDGGINEKPASQSLKDAAESCRGLLNCSGALEKVAERKNSDEKLSHDVYQKTPKSSKSSKLKRKYSLSQKVTEVSNPICQKLSVLSVDMENAVDGKGCGVGSEEKRSHNCLKKAQKGSQEKSKLKRKLFADHNKEGSPLKALKIDNDSNGHTALKPVAKLGYKVSKKKMVTSCPKSDGCARTSINGWEWHLWSSKASPALRARVRGTSCIHVQNLGSENSVTQKVLSARTNRAKMRNLLAAAEGADHLKVSQLKARKKRLRFQRSNIHDWGLVALEPIEAEDFVIEYLTYVNENMKRWELAAVISSGLMMAMWWMLRNVVALLDL